MTDIAERLLSANRPAEALDRLKTSRQIDDDDTTQIDLTVRALEALERNDEAQDVRWRFFQKTLNPDYLREHLKRLPDFEDFEAEQEGLTWAAGHQSAERALAFFTAWPNLEQAARLVRIRLSDLNGVVYYVLRPSAEALEEKYPAAASLLYRRMVESVLNRGSSKHSGSHSRHWRNDHIRCRSIQKRHCTNPQRVVQYRHPAPITAGASIKTP